MERQARESRAQEQLKFATSVAGESYCETATFIPDSPEGVNYCQSSVPSILSPINPTCQLPQIPPPVGSSLLPHDEEDHSSTQNLSWAQAINAATTNKGKEILLEILADEDCWAWEEARHTRNILGRSCLWTDPLNRAPKIPITPAHLHQESTAHYAGPSSSPAHITTHPNGPSPLPLICPNFITTHPRHTHLAQHTTHTHKRTSKKHWAPIFGSNKRLSISAANTLQDIYASLFPNPPANIIQPPHRWPGSTSGPTLKLSSPIFLGQNHPALTPHRGIQTVHPLLPIKGNIHPHSSSLVFNPLGRLSCHHQSFTGTDDHLAECVLQEKGEDMEIYFDAVEEQQGFEIVDSKHTFAEMKQQVTIIRRYSDGRVTWRKTIKWAASSSIIHNPEEINDSKMPPSLGEGGHEFYYDATSTSSADPGVLQEEEDRGIKRNRAESVILDEPESSRQRIISSDLHQSESTLRGLRAVVPKQRPSEV